MKQKAIDRETGRSDRQNFYLICVVARAQRLLSPATESDSFRLPASTVTELEWTDLLKSEISVLIGTDYMQRGGRGAVRVLYTGLWPDSTMSTTRPLASPGLAWPCLALPGLTLQGLPSSCPPPAVARGESPGRHVQYCRWQSLSPWPPCPMVKRPMSTEHSAARLQALRR
jgi:hypothetical protein